MAPRFAVGLWALGGVPHDFKGKRREAYSVPCIGWQANLVRRGAKRPENQVRRFPVEKVRRSRIRGGHRRWPITETVNIENDTNVKNCPPRGGL